MSYYVIETATEGLQLNKKQIATVIAIVESKRNAKIIANDRNLTKHPMSVMCCSVTTGTEAKQKYDLRA